jgi:hypothetical protein
MHCLKRGVYTTNHMSYSFSCADFPSKASAEAADRKYPATRLLGLARCHAQHVTPFFTPQIAQPQMLCVNVPQPMHLLLLL